MRSVTCLSIRFLNFVNTMVRIAMATGACMTTGVPEIDKHVEIICRDAWYLWRMRRILAAVAAANASGVFMLELRPTYMLVPSIAMTSSCVYIHGAGTDPVLPRVVKRIDRGDVVTVITDPVGPVTFPWFVAQPPPAEMTPCGRVRYIIAASRRDKSVLAKPVVEYRGVVIEESRDGCVIRDPRRRAAIHMRVVQGFMIPRIVGTAELVTEVLESAGATGDTTTVIHPDRVVIKYGEVPRGGDVTYVDHPTYTAALTSGIPWSIAAGGTVSLAVSGGRIVGLRVSAPHQMFIAEQLAVNLSRILDDAPSMVGLRFPGALSRSEAMVVHVEAADAAGTTPFLPAPYMERRNPSGDLGEALEVYVRRV